MQFEMSFSSFSAFICISNALESKENTHGKKISIEWHQAIVTCLHFYCIRKKNVIFNSFTDYVESFTLRIIHIENTKTLGFFVVLLRRTGERIQRITTKNGEIVIFLFSFLLVSISFASHHL